jgi:hypothetical protein
VRFYRVGEPDGGRSIVAGAVVLRFLEVVSTGAPALDGAGVGAVPAAGVEVPLPRDLLPDLGEERLSPLRGESRADGPADDADGPGEADPVGVDPGGGGGVADQRADRPAGQEVAPDLLLGQCRAARAEYLPGAAQDGLELGVRGLSQPLLIPLKEKSSLAHPGHPGRY